MTTETSNARGEVVAWIRVKPDGSPDWAEDCIADDEHFLNPAMEADGYRLRPLIYGAPPPAAARGGVRAVLQEMRDRQVARRFKSQTLTDWADRIESALSQQPEARGVVDEAMVERAALAISNHHASNTGVPFPIDLCRIDARIALTAALTGERN